MTFFVRLPKVKAHDMISPKFQFSLKNCSYNIVSGLIRQQAQFYIYCPHSKLDSSCHHSYVVTWRVHTKIEYFAGL